MFLFPFFHLNLLQSFHGYFPFLMRRLHSFEEFLNNWSFVQQIFYFPIKKLETLLVFVF